MESLLLPEAAHPHRDAPSLPSSCTFYTSPMGCAAGAAFPCREAVLGLTESWPCCVLDLLVLELFSLSQGG